MASVVEAYQALRGVAFVTAVTFVAEIGDVRRFETPRPADGLCRSGALGALDRRTGPTRQHYQSRQPKSPPCPDRGGLDVSLSGSPEPASASSTGEPAAGCAGDRLEGSAAAVRALSPADGRGQTSDPGHDSDRPRNGSLPLGDR